MELLHSPQNILTEETPDGLNQHEKGAKVDAGKPMCDVVIGGFSEALMEVTKVGTFGAEKYTQGGWKHVSDAKRRYSDAMLRHYFKSKWEAEDPDSGLPHLAHMAWNALAILHFELEERNQPKKVISLD